jgi:hypothetical protein
MGRTKPKDRLLGTHNVPLNAFHVTHSTRHRIRHTHIPALPKRVQAAAVLEQSCEDQYQEVQDYNTHDDAGHPLNGELECPVGLEVKQKKKRYLNSVRLHHHVNIP